MPYRCLGMLVEREETIIDAPTTGFRLLSVSSTVISYNTFVDAMTKAVAVSKNTLAIWLSP